VQGDFAGAELALQRAPGYDRAHRHPGLLRPGGNQEYLFILGVLAQLENTPDLIRGLHQQVTQPVNQIVPGQ
jgi:hypothetical protein